MDLLRFIGGFIYSLLGDLIVLDKLVDKLYKEIVDVLKNYLSFKLIVIFEEFCFYKRVYKFDKSVRDYIV